MTAKEKAIELVYKYSNFVSGWTTTNKPDESPSAQYEGLEMKKGRAKQFALIAVDEILRNDEYLYLGVKMGFKFWEEVKQEIENL